MSDLDAVFRALVDERRRRVLSCLERHHAVPLADLAERVAETTAPDAGSIADISGEEVRDVYLTLYHVDVPVLEEADLVRYDQADDVVTREAVPPTPLRSAREEIDDILG